MKHTVHTGRQAKLLFARLSGIVLIALSLTAVAQTAPVEQPVPQATIQVETRNAGSQEPVLADYVSIHVDGGTLRQVLNAFSMQTQRNVVIGPEVTAEGVSIHLNNVRWDDALDVILKPYGFGYRKVGDTVVVSKLDKLAGLAAVELLETKVFNLKYLDANDVQDLIKGQLSPRGTISVAASRGMKGWKNDPSGGNRSRGSGNAMSLVRVEEKTDTAERVRSKTLLVTDVPGSLARIADVLASLDQMQQQIQVEARFMEVNQSLLKEAGLDFTKVGLFAGAVSSGEGENKDGTADKPATATETEQIAPGSFNSLTWKAGADATATINFLQQDDDTKVLSAPRILTLNNQEATIMVGQRYPILTTDLGAGTTTIATTTLDYYENIGIQLNVVPQICADGYINMIVRPVVSSIAGLALGPNGIASAYPIINTRETETQIMLKTGETGVIGGLLEERKGGGVQKIPVLGSIPLIGRLFRNETTNNKTVDLLIFLTATIVDEKNYDTILAKEGSTEMSGKSAVTKEEAAPAGTM